MVTQIIYLIYFVSFYLIFVIIFEEDVILFFFLAKKPTNQYQLVVECAEFYVFVVLLVASVILLCAGATFVCLGIAKKRSNSRLLKDINNRTFVQ